MAVRLAAASDTEAWSFAGSVTHVGENFNPEVGFLRRKDYTRVGVFGLNRWRDASWDNLLEMRPHIAYRGWWGGDGLYETGFGTSITTGSGSPVLRFTRALTSCTKVSGRLLNLLPVTRSQRVITTMKSCSWCLSQMIVSPFLCA